MIDWLTEQLCCVMRWQLANPGSCDDPDAPEVPWAGVRIWGIFLELNSARSSGFSAEPISFQQIEAWAWLRREPVRPWEVDVIRSLDVEFLRHARSGPLPAAKVVQSRPMSPTLFDTIFG
jgi:hypothetical protein